MSEGQALEKISIAKPIIGQDEKQAVMEVLESGHLVQGKFVEDFEQAFAKFQGVKYAIATNNGTTALSTALLASGVEAGDEVIIPSFSFVATATSVLSIGATPIFVDVEPETFCIDPELIIKEITPKTKAIMPVHLFGHPANMPIIDQICKKYNLLIIEDAAQAHGSKINGTCIGGWGAAAFSFYATKNMTSGEGGMVTTNNREIAERARMVRNHGMNAQYYHEVIGFNYRMTNIAAAIGLSQLPKLSGWNKQRIQNANYFNKHIQSVKIPITREDYYHVFHQYTVVTEEENRNNIVQELNKKGIDARVYYPIPIHSQPIFKQHPQSSNNCQCTDDKNCKHLPMSRKLSNSVFSLPVHPSLTQDDLERIVYEVNRL